MIKEVNQKESDLIDMIRIARRTKATMQRNAEAYILDLLYELMEEEN